MTLSAQQLDDLLELRSRLIEGGLDPATAHRKTVEAGRRLGTGGAAVDAVAREILEGEGGRRRPRTEDVRTLVGALKDWGLSDDDALEAAMSNAHRLERREATAVARDLVIARAADRKREEGNYGDQF